MAEKTVPKYTCRVSQLAAPCQTDFAPSFKNLARIEVEPASYLHSQCHFCENARLWTADLDPAGNCANCEIGA